MCRPRQRRRVSAPANVMRPTILHVTLYKAIWHITSSAGLMFPGLRPTLSAGAAAAAAMAAAFPGALAALHQPRCHSSRCG